MGKISDAMERHKKETTLKKSGPLPAPEAAGVGVAEPLAGHDHRLVVLADPHSLEAEHFKMLRGQILFPKEGKVPRTIMVTSSYPGEGKTYVAANLAVSIALGVNEHVLLIDCDLRKPKLHDILGYANRQGLTEHLAGEKPLPDLIIRTGIEKLAFLPAGGPSTHSAELLTSAKMKEFLIEVKDRYPDRFVIMDGTPSQITAESNVLAGFVDGVVFVVLAEKAPRAAVRKSVELMGRDKTLGVVFNGYNESYTPYLKFHRKYCVENRA